MKAMIDFVVVNGQRINVTPDVVEVTQQHKSRRNWYVTPSGDIFKCLRATRGSRARKMGAELVAVR